MLRIGGSKEALHVRHGVRNLRGVLSWHLRFLGALDGILPMS